MKKEAFLVEDYKVNPEDVIIVEPQKYECPWCGYIGSASVSLSVADIEPPLQFGPFCMICIGKFLSKQFPIMMPAKEEENGEETG